MKVAIIGMGVVGKAQVELFAEHTIVSYDIAHVDPYPQEDIDTSDFAVICVGTPRRIDGGADVSQVSDAIARLRPNLPVMIRSTVPPGFTATLADGRIGHTVHVPEFLHERKGGLWQRSADVPFMILGGTWEAACWFLVRIRQVWHGPLNICSAIESELAKYAINLFHATKVTFVNELAAICESMGVDWEAVRSVMLMDPRVGSDYTAMAGFPPGFAGRCWPKDLDALIHTASISGYDAWFLDAVRIANERFRNG